MPKKSQLTFNKDHTAFDNYKQFERYSLRLDSKFGKVLLQNIDKSPDEIRDFVKESIIKLFENDESNLH